MVKTKIAVLVSGGGTNLQALLDAQQSGALTAGEIVLVIASNDKAYALTRAANAGVPAVVCSRKALGGREAFETALSRLLAEYGWTCHPGWLPHHPLAGLHRPLAPAHSERPSLPDPVLLREGNVRSEGP